MSDSTTMKNSSDTDSPQLKATLGTPSLVLFGLVYMVPLTIFTTYGIVTQITGGRLPLAYLITLVAMLFTARSYGLLSRAFPVAGSAYVYSRRTFGGPVGFLTGWALMMDYLFLPMINYLVLGIYAHEAIPVIPAWIFTLAAVILVTTLNLFGIVTIARTTYVIVALQAIFIVVFLIASVATLSGQGSVDLISPFRGDGSETGFNPLVAGAAILCLSFLGFDAVSTFSEDAKEPRRTVPRAIMLTTLIAGALFTGLAYVSYLVLPQTTFDNVDSAAVEVMSSVGGAFIISFFTAAYVAGSLGSALTSQAAVSRIIYSMGRDGVLPKSVFGRLSARYKSPFAAIILTSLIGLLALVIDLDTVSSLISFGALTAFSLVNLAVIRHFLFKEKARGFWPLINYFIVPLMGFLITIWLWTSLSSLALLVGIIWVTLGIVWLAIITKGFRRPTPDLEGMD